MVWSPKHSVHLLLLQPLTFRNPLELQRLGALTYLGSHVSLLAARAERAPLRARANVNKNQVSASFRLGRVTWTKTKKLALQVNFTVDLIGLVFVRRILSHNLFQDFVEP